jgi:hypothetical protein
MRLPAMKLFRSVKTGGHRDDNEQANDSDRRAGRGTDERVAAW